MLAVVGALLLGPLVVAALHELATVERDGLLVSLDEAFGVARAAGGIALADEPVELLRVDAVGELGLSW